MKNFFKSLVLVCLAIGLSAASWPIDITAPAERSTVFGTVRVKTDTASPPVVIEYLFVDSAFYQIMPLAPFWFIWNTTGLSDGFHTILIAGYDSVGLYQGARLIRVFVNNTNPTPTPTGTPTATPTPSPTPTATPTPLVLTNPANSSTVSGTVSIVAVVSGLVSWVNVYIDGDYFLSSPPYTFPWNSNAVANGGHIVLAKAYSSIGAQIGSDSKNVTVSNTPTPTPTATATPSPTPTPTATPTPTGFFVSTTGNDSNSGTDTAHPWATLSKVASHTFSPGAHIYFHCQDVWNEQLLLSNENGSVGSRIIYDGSHWGTCAEPTNTLWDHIPGNVKMAVINGGSTRPFGIKAALFANVSYLTIHGFDVHDVTKGAIGFSVQAGATYPGIIIERNHTHQNGPGACSGCGSPTDDGDYDNNGGIAFNDYGQGQDCVQILNNTDWDNGGHNSLRIHYDTCATTLVDGNFVGPGCVHNCFDNKGINGTVQYNVATCDQSSKRGAQCHNTGTNDDAGFYTENTYVSAGTHPTYKGNLAYNVPRGFQAVQDSSHLIIPKYYNDTVYGSSPLDNALDLSLTTTPDIRKNIVSGKVSVPGGTLWDYNDKVLTSGAPSGTHDIAIDPAYVSPGGADFRPTNATVLTGAIGSAVTPYSYFGALANTPISTPTPTPTPTPSPTPTATPTPPPGFFNPRSYGAVGNGIHDDSAAFQAALNSGNIFVSSVPGSNNFLINTTVTATGGRTIQCDSAVVIHTSVVNTSNRSIFRFQASGNWGINHCHLTGPNNIANPTYALANDPNILVQGWCWGASGCSGTIDSNVFEGCMGNACLSIYGNDSTGPVRGGTITNNTFNGCGIYGVALVSATNWTVSGNISTACAMGPEADDTGQLNTGNVFSNNVLHLGGNDGYFNTGHTAFPVFLTCGQAVSNFDYSTNSCHDNILDSGGLLMEGGGTTSHVATYTNNKCGATNGVGGHVCAGGDITHY